MIIDASNLIVGRFATVAAKNALLGEKVDIINCEKAFMTGSRAEIVERYKKKRAMGIPSKGPFIPRMPDRFVRRVIRGMLPHRQAKGREAFKRIMCYIGVPDNFKDQEKETFEKANVKKVPNLKYMCIGDICRIMGGKL